MPPKDFIIPRRGTKAQWDAKSPSPVLALGEIAIETDTRKTKYGDGSTSWNDLPYSTCPVDGSDVPLQVARDTDANLAALTDPFLEGQLIYNKTTGKTVIGDGESLYDDLPDLRKQFQNVVTVSKTGKKGSADFICSDYDSDAACIQAALDSIASDQVIHISSGTYSITSNVAESNKNITIVGIGKVKFEINTGLTTPAITFIGSHIGDYPLSADALINTRSVSISGAESTIHSGDIIIITNAVLWCPHDFVSQNTGESYLVTSVSGDTVSLNQALLRDNLIAKSSTAYIYRPIIFQLENIEIVNQSSTGSIQSLNLQYCVNSKISKCDLGNSGTSAIVLNTCYDVDIFSNHIHDCERAGYGYGISISNASASINIHDNRIERCRHCVMCGTSTFNGLNRDISVNDNTLVSGTAVGSVPIDSHTQVLNYTAKNNHIYLSDAATEACINNSESLIFSGNHVYGGYAVRRRGKKNSGNYEISNNIITNGGIYYDSQLENAKGSLKILGNNVTNCEYAIKTTVEIYDRIDIIGNTIDTTTDNAIQLRVPRSDATNDIYEVYADKPTSINISENFIKFPGRAGIYIDKAQTGYPANVTILGNDITNVNLDNGYNGIHLTDVSNSIISKNKISGVYNGTGYHIFESELYETVNNNHIENNILTDLNGLDPNTTHTIIDLCDDITGWNNAQGTVTSKIIENGKIKVVGTTDANGRLQLYKSFTAFGTELNFISFYMNSNVSGKIRCTLQSSTGNSISWLNDSRFIVSSNVDTFFSFPTRLITSGTTGLNPSSVSGTFVPNSITQIYIGIYDTALPNTEITFYIDEILGSVGNFISKVGIDSKIINNAGYISENIGTATISATTTSITVSHGLAATPKNVIVTPRGNVGSVWADTFTATELTIHCSSAPETDTVVGWSAVV